MAAAAAPAAVAACEPNPRVVERLKANLALNGIENVRVHQVAVTDSVGSLTLYVPNDESFNQATASLVRHPTAPTLVNARTVQVASLTLDVIVAREGLKHVDLIKVDVEGYEGLVLAGGLDVLTRDRPILIFEYERNFWKDANQSLPATLSWLQRFGYSQVHRVERRGLIPLNEPFPPSTNLLVSTTERLRQLELLPS